MNQNDRIRELAGLTLTEGKKWSGDVKTKVEVPDGTFKKKAGAIVKALLKLHDGDRGAASKALNFYINRAGKDVENKEELDKAKEQIKKVEESFESLQAWRRSAGLPLLEKKMDDKDIDAMDDDTGEEPPKGKKDEGDDLPSIVKKIAKNACKKFGIGDPKGGESEDLSYLQDLLLKVYDAGHKDGEKGGKDSADKEVDDALDEAVEAAGKVDPKGKEYLARAASAVKQARAQKKKDNSADKTGNGDVQKQFSEAVDMDKLGELSDKQLTSHYKKCCKAVDDKAEGSEAAKKKVEKELKSRKMHDVIADIQAK